MAQRDKVKELVGRGLNSYHTKSLQQIDRIEKKNKEQNHKISILSNELDNDYLTKTEEGSVISLEHSKEGMVYLDELQGNTLVNYCTDGSKEMTLNGDIDVEGTFVTTTEGVDNGLVDVACEGNTLVNLVKTPKKSTTSSYTSVYDMMYAKENTEYTIGFKLTNVVKGDYTGKFNISIENTPNSQMIQVPFENGAYKIKVTTRNVNSNPSLNIAETVKVCFWTVGTNMRESYTVSDVYALEGDYLDKDLICFEGMKSVGELEENKIEILSQNTIKITDYFYGTQSNGTNAHNPSWTSLFFKCKPNTTYTVEKLEESNRFGIEQCFYNGEGKSTTGNTELSRYTDNSPIKTFTTKDISYGDYIKVYLSNQQHKQFNVFITESGGDIDSLNYKSNKKEILMNEPLRGINEDIKDTIMKINNKWYIKRICKEVIINGDTPITAYYTHGVNNDMIVPYYSSQAFEINSYALCDKLPFYKYPSNSNPIGKSESMTVGTGTGGAIFLTLKKSNFANSDLQTYLNNNPIKCIVKVVNPIYEEITDVELITYLDTTHISNNSTIPCNMKIQNSGYNAIIKPSTLYTVALDTNKSGTIGINLGGAKVTTTNNVATITTPATLTDDSLRIYGKDIKGSKVRLLEGDKTNWIPSHFEGMKSSFEDKVQEDGTYKMEILSVNDHNLLDISSPIQGGWSNGILDTQILAGDYTFNHFIEIIPNATYKFETKGTIHQKWKGMYYFDENKKQIGGKYYNTYQTTYTFVPPSYAKYMVMWCEKAVVDLKPMLTVYKNETDYIDYTELLYNKIQFSSIEPLREVYGTKDRLTFVNNKLMIERNCGTLNINSSQGFARASKYDNGHLYGFEKDFTGIKPVFHNTKAIKCDKYVYYPYDGDNHMRGKKEEWVGTWSNNLDRFVIMLRLKTKENTLSSLNEYLNENPISVTYIKKEPTYEEIPFELQKIILEGYENGTLFFDTNIPPTSKITYAGETPIVRSVKLNKTEVLSNTEDINDNIIPYLMDMDYRVVMLQLATEELEGGVSMARLFGGTYEMIKRDILSKRLTREEYGHRLADYFNAGKLTEEQVRELEELR